MATDNSGMIDILEDFPKQIKESLSMPKGMTAKKGISKIVVAGMGGSAIGGDLLALFMEHSDIPVIVARDYTLPTSVDEKTLIFAVSYSGNTEETIAVAQEAKKRKAPLIGITSGGQLAEICDKVITIPSGLPPRCALGYLFFPMLGICYNSGFLKVRNDDVNELISTIETKREHFKQKANELAGKLDGKIPIIYSSSRCKPIAYRFKTQINENSKSPAFCNTFPELNHNELVGYQGMDRKQFVVLTIEDKEDHERIQKRFALSKEIIKRNVDIISIKTVGNGLYSRVFATIHFLDLVSYYLALRKRIDPTPVEVIDELKERLQ